MKRVLDVENTTTKRNNKLHLDPFEADNTLTQVGVQDVDTHRQYIYTFDHEEQQDYSGDAFKAVQNI